MKRISRSIIMALLCLLTWQMAAAQPVRPGGNHKFERIKALKISYITDRLQLAPEQAEKFWPIYNQYEADLSAIRREFRDKSKSAPADNSKMNAKEEEAQSLRYVDDNLAMQEKVIALKKRYRDRFLTVLSAQQMASLIDAERDFKKMLLDRLQNNRAQTQPQG